MMKNKDFTSRDSTEMVMQARPTLEQKLPIASDSHPIVLFDGVCNLCNSSVQFIIDRDPLAVFRFAPLQSELGVMLRTMHGLPEDIETIVLIDNSRAYTRSGAALRIAKRLKGGWKMLYGLIVVPAFVRNWCYDWIARNRYEWYGKEDSCRLPTPELESRFLVQDDRA